ncbi:hypothetical protein ACL02T_10835 [Pseudonocardia sp. RS010]|uniref:hypothetical protein n=1 Tax=Pseudonocardia sp. RS010 TaxID=3385979 RepID=UPI0039A3AD9B
MGHPEWLPDVGAGNWIAARLDRLDGTVGQHVPAVFDAYARIMHPPHTMAGEPGTWAQVCTSTGTIAHPLMQWLTISRTHDVPAAGGGVTLRSAWSGSPPEEGNLPVRSLTALLDVLAEPTAAVRVRAVGGPGLGRRPRRLVPAHRAADGTVIEEGEPPSAFPLEVLDGPRLALPGRNYLLFTGPLADAAGLGDPRGIWPQSPNLFWPQDRSWCVATEIDFDSTLIGGSRRLIDAVLACLGLEAWPVSPGDSLAWDADTLNR